MRTRIHGTPSRMRPLARSQRRTGSAGAEVFNVADSQFDERGFVELPDGPLATIIDGWLAYVRRAAI